MSTTFFCPFCGKRTPGDSATCPQCKRSIGNWKTHPFEERLLLTLRHPILEQRMMAIQILGQKRYERAVPVFAAMISEGQDVYTLKEIATALIRINTPESRQVLAVLHAHPSAVVRKACEEVFPGSNREALP